MRKSYFRVILGLKNSFAQQCYNEGWFGGDWQINVNLSKDLPEDWKVFNKTFIPLYLSTHPDKSKVTAGLACGMLHTICKGIKRDDVILSPNGQGAYWIGRVIGDYQYVQDQKLPHRRRVEWFPYLWSRADMSEGLRRSTGSIGTVCNINKHADEIEGFLVKNSRPQFSIADDTIEDPAIFALEKHLEDFLVQNWENTILGKNYNILEDEGELIGQQYRTDTGPIDLLAISKDRKELLVIELKKGRASDVVVGQIQRYMGFVRDEFADPGQRVRGCIVALEKDLKLQRALSMTADIDFYHYQVRFTLEKN